MAAKVNVTLPLRVVKHSYVVTDVIPQLEGKPNVRWPDKAVYLKVNKLPYEFMNQFIRDKLQLDFP